MATNTETNTKTTTELSEGDTFDLTNGAIFEVWEVNPHPQAQYPHIRVIEGYLTRPAGICEPWSLNADTSKVFEVH